MFELARRRFDRSCCPPRSVLRSPSCGSSAPRGAVPRWRHAPMLLVGSCERARSSGSARLFRPPVLGESPLPVRWLQTLATRRGPPTLTHSQTNKPQLGVRRAEPKVAPTNRSSCPFYRAAQPRCPGFPAPLSSPGVVGVVWCAPPPCPCSGQQAAEFVAAGVYNKRRHLLGPATG